MKLSVYEKWVIVNLVQVLNATATKCCWVKLGVSLAALAQAQTICCVL